MKKLVLVFCFCLAAAVLFGAGQRSSAMRDDEELKKKLTPEQYRVTCQGETEQPFANEYWDNKKPGIYVDIISGKPLFSSNDKFDSGTGWPSFTKPIEESALAERSDRSLGTERTEVRSQKSDAHLGHVFADGPKPAGRRYCINSAALRFIPLENMEKEGYGRYLYLFGKTTGQSGAVAYFAAGCFWGVEAAFRQVKGVKSVTSGYMGGNLADPTYGQVCTGTTGHAETVKVEYDPEKVSYEALLEVLWSIHDPTTPYRQGPDVGAQYRSAIFYADPQQEAAAQASKDKLAKSGKYDAAIVTEITPAKDFYKAEEYHQRYYEKNGIKPACHLPPGASG